MSKIKYLIISFNNIDDLFSAKIQYENLVNIFEKCDNDIIKKEDMYAPTITFSTT